MKAQVKGLVVTTNFNRHVTVKHGRPLNLYVTFCSVAPCLIFIRVCQYLSMQLSLYKDVGLKA